MASDAPQEPSWHEEIEEMPVHQQRMLHACSTGDISELQKHFDAAEVMRGSTPTQRTIDPIDPLGPPATSDLLHTAVTHNQPAVLQLLLKTYPSARVSTDVLLGSTFANPDLPTLEVLRCHDPSIVNYEMDENDGFDTLLIDYCRSGDPLRPTYLLDNGADPNLGGLPHFGGPLLTAIVSNQPPSLISNMIECNAKATSLHVTYTIRESRVDILDMVLRHCRWEVHRSPRQGLEKALREAQETSNREIISLTEKYLAIEKSKRRWWQIRS